MSVFKKLKPKVLIFNLVMIIVAMLTVGVGFVNENQELLGLVLTPEALGVLVTFMGTVSAVLQKIGGPLKNIKDSIDRQNE